MYLLLSQFVIASNDLNGTIPTDLVLLTNVEMINLGKSENDNEAHEV